MGKKSVLFGVDVSSVKDLKNKTLSYKEYRNKRIIISLSEGKEVNECCCMFNLKRSRIHDISKKYLTCGVSSIFDKKGVKRNVKITDDMHNFIGCLLHDDSPINYDYKQEYWSIKILHQVLMKTFYYDISYSTIVTHVHKLDYSFKVPSRVSVKSDEQEVAEYEAEIKKKSKR